MISIFRTSDMVSGSYTRHRLPVQIESSNGAVQRGTNYHKATGSKGDISDTACVLCECDETQAVHGVPHLHLKNDQI